MSAPFKYILKLWILLFGLSEVSCFLALQLLHRIPNDPIQKGYRGMLIMMSLFGVICMSIAAATMFFAVVRIVRLNTALRWLSFFLLPLLFAAATLKPFSNDFLPTLVTYLPIMLPFFIWLVLGYILFSKWSSRQKLYEQIRNNQLL